MGKLVDMKELEQAVRAMVEGELDTPVSTVTFEENAGRSARELFVRVKLKRLDRALTGAFMADLQLKVLDAVVAAGAPRIPVVFTHLSRGQKVEGF